MGQGFAFGARRFSNLVMARDHGSLATVSERPDIDKESAPIHHH